jgi:hypothetical protein
MIGLTPPPEPFDVREFARTAQGSLRDDIDLAAFDAAPLPREVGRMLAVLARLEGATMAHLRNVLVTPTHKDARVTAFLVSWAFEKFWIADALRAVAEAVPGGEWSVGISGASPLGGRGPVRRAIAGVVQGPPVVGAHLSLGLVDDWVLRAAYERVDAEAASAALSDVVDRILGLKARHTSFFGDEVHRRLSASKPAARLARRELRRTPLPLGSAVLEPADRAFFTRFTFDGDRGDALAAAIQRDIRNLPGMNERTSRVLRGAITVGSAS